MAQLVKNLPAMWETQVWSPGWKDPPGEGKGFLLQYSGLENSMDCTVHRVAKTWTRLSDFHFQLIDFRQRYENDFMRKEKEFSSTNDTWTTAYLYPVMSTLHHTKTLIWDGIMTQINKVRVTIFWEQT